ncbi:MAG: hypothetical protein AABW51_03650 [Nanoarchaeota archaeon]
MKKEELDKLQRIYNKGILRQEGHLFGELGETKDKEGVARMIKEWHKIQPKYVFLTETSGTPWGYLIKAAWKEAYPNETVPKFYRVDPITLTRADYYYSRNRDKRKEREQIDNRFEEFFNERIKDKHSQIIIFDESSATGHSLNITKEYLKKKVPSQNIHPFTGDNYLSSGSAIPAISVTGKKTKYSSKVGYPPSEYRFTGEFIHDVDNRKLVKNYITKMKEWGKIIGKEIKNKGNLEGKVTSIIAIVSLSLSILFMSSNITSNVISNLDNTLSNWISLVLFVIGLVCSLLYLKKKS